MSTLEEVKQMQAQGMQENEIVDTLQQRGIQYKEISEALAQSKIKAAVEAPTNEPSDEKKANSMTQEAPFNMPKSPMQPIPTPNTQQKSKENSSEAIPGMQQSIMNSSSPNTQSQYPEISQQPQEYFPQTPTPESQTYPEYQDYGNDNYGYDQGYQDYPSYDYAMPGSISPDTISEISEQIVAEKMLEVRKHLNKFTDFKTEIEAKAEAIEQRLTRMEKIIDALQTSVLHKVGEYGTNISDIKKELITTQKTFAKLAPGIRKHSSSTNKTNPHKKHRKRKTSKKK